MLLVYKTWGYYNKFDSTKFVGDITDICQNTTIPVLYAWIKYIAFYVQKPVATRVVCYNFPLLHEKLLGPPTFVELVYQ